MGHCLRVSVGNELFQRSVEDYPAARVFFVFSGGNGSVGVTIYWV
jgi:hypothetical protein